MTLESHNWLNPSPKATFESHTGFSSNFGKYTKNRDQMFIGRKTANAQIRNIASASSSNVPRDSRSNLVTVDDDILKKSSA